MRASKIWKGPGASLMWLALVLGFAASMSAQGVLSVTPSTTLSTAAGTGSTGYTGDGGAAASATLASPSAVGYDTNGNLFFADTLNHVVREVSNSGQVSTVAGTGIEGYGGDNAPATSAYLDTPTGVALDSAGNIYIADSHNHRVRKVSNGTITTIAGTGTAGFSGDNGSAVAAQLWLPTAVAVDAAGNVYIADTKNQRVREITGTTITTIAGNGEELFAGDGATAAAAVLDSPTGVAVDAAGNVYIADRHNHRVRMVNPAGTISTIAGSGTFSFSGAFAGDGASAITAALAKPTGISVDAAGNVYIADTDNQRIRQISGGTISTVAGGGLQGFGGDGGPATNAVLNAPKAVASDLSGDLIIADALNQRLRTASAPALTFANDGVGIMSTPQPVTLANTGSASITVGSIAFTGAFTTTPGGSCSAAPITLAAGASCTENLVFLPTASGAASGSVTFGGPGIVPQNILLHGTGTQSATTVTLISNIATPFVGQAVMLTATVHPAGLGTPVGTVSFYDGTALLGTSTLTGGSASFTTTLVAGTQNLTAAYPGNANFTGNSSSTLAEVVTDFTLMPSSSTAATQSIEPGQTASYTFSLQPVAGGFTLPIQLSATGLPPGATVTFAPQTVTPGSSPASVTISIHTAATGALLAPHHVFGKATIALSFILLPFSGWTRRRLRGMRPLTLCAALLLSLAAVSGLAGCGSSGFFAQPAQTYTINIIGSATATGGAILQHSSSVTLTVQ